MRTRRAYDSRGTPGVRETKTPRTVMGSKNGTVKREMEKNRKDSFVYLTCVRAQKRRIRPSTATPLVKVHVPDRGLGRPPSSRRRKETSVAHFREAVCQKLGDRFLHPTHTIRWARISTEVRWHC